MLDRRGGRDVFAAAAGLLDLDRRRARAVELAPQRLRGVDVDFALVAGGAVGQELQAVLADLDRVPALQQVLLDRLAVDGRAVGGTEVLEVDLAAEV